MAVKYWTGKADLYEIDYDNGGGGTAHVPIVGEVLYVNGSEATEYATVQAWTVTSGTWLGNDAAGKMWVYSATAAFIANLEEDEELEDADANVVVDITAVALVARITGDWQVAGNWGTGEDPAVPLADDEVIFDSRSSLAPTEGMLDGESGAVAQCTFDLLHFKTGYTAGVASAAEPLCCAPDRVVIEGTGTYYILNGKTSQGTDSIIANTIINNTAAIVYLYSNATGGFSSVYTNIAVVGGTVTGAYYTLETDVGINITELLIAPTSNRISDATVTIEKDATCGIIHLNSGTLTIDSACQYLYQMGGICYFGSDLGAAPETALDITVKLLLYGGTFYWRPDDSGNDAYIKQAHIFGGKFDASGTTNNDRAKVLGGGAGYNITVYTGALMYLNNNRGNITKAAGSKIYNMGGTIKLDSNCDMSLTYDT